MPKKTHGLSNTREFSVWTDMQTRCYNKKRSCYRHYGGRGISVCDRWMKFENFLEDMGERPLNMTLDRIDNNGNYSPENCRWATYSEQSRNKRNNRLIEIEGVTKTLKDWSDLCEMTSTGIMFRVERGLSGKDLIAPSNKKGSITYNNITDTVEGWSKRTGIKKTTIFMRINKYGWSIEKSLTKGV